MRDPLSREDMGHRDGTEAGRELSDASGRADRGHRANGQGRPGARPPSLLLGLRRFLSESERSLRQRNRRRFDRHPCEFPVELHVEEAGAVKVVAAKARNISNNGMLLECSYLPSPRAVCRLEFGFPQWSAPGRDEVSPVKISAQVRHCETSQSTFGVAFAIPLGLALKSLS